MKRGLRVTRLPEHELNRRRHALRCRLGTMSALRSAQRWPGRPLLLGAARPGVCGCRPVFLISGGLAGAQPALPFPLFLVRCSLQCAISPLTSLTLLLLCEEYQLDNEKSPRQPVDHSA